MNNLVKRFLEKTPFNFINLSNQKDLLHKMEVFSYPTSFILDKDGNFISFVPVGNEMYTKKILEKLIAN
ncbi:thioredoxin-related protein [Chryseobacterium sp. SORGH_AS 1048]|nr:thioredoxin-related protein [Chryseobacterium sp. SORGH_AS_1048]